jgi:DNA mismatch repair protein MutS
LPRIKAKVTARRSALLRELERRLELCPDLRESLDLALADDPAVSAREGGVIRAGYHAELDEQRELARGGKEWITRFQAAEITRTGIPSLKVGFNKVFGYYIEVTHTHTGKVPEGYQRRQTLTNAERYVTAELREYEDRIVRAQERANQLEQDLFLSLRERVAAETSRLMQTAGRSWPTSRCCTSPRGGTRSWTRRCRPGRSSRTTSASGRRRGASG